MVENAVIIRMNLSMTNSTYGNNIEPTLRLVAFVMMPMVCLVAAFTNLCRYMRYFTYLYSIINRIFCLYFRGIQVIPFFHSFIARLFSLFCFLIFLTAFSMFLFTFICHSIFLVIHRLASFAGSLGTVFARRFFTKLRSGFNLLAFVTSFGYNFGSHFRSFQRLWLEPVAAQTAIGSLIICEILGGVNNE